MNNPRKNTRMLVYRVLDVRWLLASWMLISLAGCGGEQESLHELDHYVPAHWPTNLQQAAELVTARADIAERDETAFKELDDVLSWIPEVAADTDLDEADWLPIFERCESLRRVLRRGYTAGTGAELQQLAETLHATHEKFMSLQPRGWSAPGDESPAMSEEESPY